MERCLPNNNKYQMYGKVQPYMPLLTELLVWGGRKSSLTSMAESDIYLYLYDWLGTVGKNKIRQMPRFLITRAKRS